MGKAAKRYGEGLVIKAGIVISAIGFGLILLVDSFLTAAIYLSIFGIGNGVIRPAVSALLTKTVASGHGSVTGLLSSFDSLGRIAGPPIGGALYGLAIGLPYIRESYYRSLRSFYILSIQRNPKQRSRIFLLINEKKSLEGKFISKLFSLS